jgi:hypothetical protein
MMVFVLKGLGGDLFTFFHRVSALIIDLVSWHSSSCSMDLFMMRELCFPCVCYSFDLFAPDLEKLVTRVSEGIFLQLYLYARFTRAA